jgi:general secretion pathway protein A
MYAPYFGLSHEPFSIAPDPRYLYMSERHREALAHLLYGVGGGGGFVLLTGEIGTGKTTVCRCFLEQIPPATDVAYIFNPKLTALELLQSVCDEFHIAVPRKDGATAKDWLDPLNAYLLQAHAGGRNSVLVIDEAQNLSADVLEQLRLLTNLETSERKLLQIILIGQPELRTLLARPELEQLAQRVIARYHLDALTTQETVHYVRHRLEVAGLSRALPFEPRALALVHRLTGGVPRRINLLCDRALLGAYARSEAAVTPAVVRQAAHEVFGGAENASPRTWPRQALVLGLGIAAGAGLVAATRWFGPAAPAAPVVASREAVRPAAPASVPAAAVACAAIAAGFGACRGPADPVARRAQRVA